MTDWLKWSGGLLALIGVIIGAIYGMDERYANAASTKLQISELKILYMESERRDLKRQEFELRVVAERRKLTDLEQRRLQEIQEELLALQRRIEVQR